MFLARGLRWVLGRVAGPAPDVNGGETYLQWQRHKLLRKKSIIVEDEEGKRPLLLTHYVWPETLRLLNEHAAPADNPHGLMLLNHDGRPLWLQEMHHKRALDSISTAFGRMCRRANVDFTFSQIRKWGGTAAEAKRDGGGVEVQEMYRGERRQGSSRVYVLPDFTERLRPWLKSWAERLRANGVLYD